MCAAGVDFIRHEVASISPSSVQSFAEQPAELRSQNTNLTRLICRVDEKDFCTELAY